jgi:hypothetical protein
MWSPKEVLGRYVGVRLADKNVGDGLSLQGGEIVRDIKKQG